MSPCVLCYSKSRNNKVQACPHAPPPTASGEGRDAHVRFYWLQFGDNANAVADNRGVVEGEQRGEAKTILSNLSYSGLKAGRWASICYW